MLLKKNRIAAIKKALTEETTQPVIQKRKTFLTEKSPSLEDSNMPVATATQSDQIKAELDEIIAAECLYCGENMIRTIDMPFIQQDELDMLKSWQI